MDFQAGALSSSAQLRRRPIEKPNVIVIITDQQRADTLGAYGSAVGVTPNIDALAAAGATFERGYCNNPLCMPSRASILTGRYPNTSGVRTNGAVAHSGQALLPELLANAGYRTAAFGKVHYHPCRSQPPEYWPENLNTIASGADLTQPYLGFQTTALGCGHSDVMPGLHEQFLAEQHPEVYARRGPDGALVVPDPLLHHAQKLETYKTAIPEELYPTTWVMDRTVEYIEAAREPFFVWCGINDPHHSFKPPGRYWDMLRPADMPPPVRRDGELADKPPHFTGFHEGRYREIDTDGFLLGSQPYLSAERVAVIRAAYYGMVAMIDDNVGRLLAALDNSGLRENTIIIFTSDHGEFLGDHDFVLKGPMHYESLLRVPFLASWPERFPAGRRLDGPVGLIDLFPTVLDLCQVAAPDGVQGRSLATPLTGESDRGHDYVYVENDVDPLGLRLRTLITDRWKLTWYAGEDYGEIYDLEQDPNEFVNLWDRCDPKVKHDLVAQLLDVVTTNQDVLPPKICHA